MRVIREQKENYKIIHIKNLNIMQKNKILQVYSRQNIEEIKNKIKIAFLDNYIVDITDFIAYHPGGQINLLEATNYDISRYLSATAAINSNFEPNSHKLSTYQHIFEKMIIGVFSDDNKLVMYKQVTEYVEDEEVYLSQTRKIAKSTNEFKFTLKNKNSNYNFSRFLPGYDWVGRHYAVKSHFLFLDFEY